MGGVLARRGNAVAAILIVVLLLAGIGVITYSEFMAQERQIDYPRIHSEIQNVLDRVFLRSTSRLMENGFSNATNVWYCNEPMPPNATEVGEGFSFYTADELQGIKMAEFLSGVGAENITIGTIKSTPDLDVKTAPDLSGIDTLAMNITDLEIAIVGDDENMTVNGGMNAAVKTHASYYYSVLQQWMACNAGNITQRVAAAASKTPCRFESCCCGTFPISPAAQQAIKDDYGVKLQDVDDALNLSVEALNSLFAGSTCFGPAQRGNVTCVINESQSLKILQNNITYDYSERSCGSTQCEIKALAGYNGTPQKWDSEFTTRPAQGCPDRPQLAVDTGILPETQTPPPHAPTSSTATSRYFMIALQRKAAANILVTCTARSDPDAAPEVFNIRLRVNVKSECSLPPNTPSDTSVQACLAGNTQTCPCPLASCFTTCEEGTLVNSRPHHAVCNELCKVVKQAYCGDEICDSDSSCECGGGEPRCADRYSCGEPTSCRSCPGGGGGGESSSSSSSGDDDSSSSGGSGSSSSSSSSSEGNEESSSDGGSSSSASTPPIINPPCIKGCYDICGGPPCPPVIT
jgi:hypothetical protein